MMPYFRINAMPPGRPETLEERKPLEPGKPRTGAEKGSFCALAPWPPRGPPPSAAKAQLEKFSPFFAWKNVGKVFMSSPFPQK